jgi:hypothetical protein
MTELKPSMMLRYFTNENGKHFTATVLKDNSILSLKRAGEKDKTKYDSLIHWLASLPGTVTISDLDIQERTIIPKPPNSKNIKTITLNDLAPTYDLFRFLLTYEAYSLKNSLASLTNTFKFETRTYVQDAEGNLHPIKYNRFLKTLYSPYHDKFVTNLEDLGFPANANIFVKISGVYYGKKYRQYSLDMVKLPFTSADYKSFYDAKFAFVITPILNYVWGQDTLGNNYYHTLICNYLKQQGYTIFTKCCQNYNSDSIFINKIYKYLEANIVTVFPSFTQAIVQNYKPLSLAQIRFNQEDKIILSELKSIL